MIKFVGSLLFVSRQPRCGCRSTDGETLIFNTGDCEDGEKTTKKMNYLRRQTCLDSPRKLILRIISIRRRTQGGTVEITGIPRGGGTSRKNFLPREV